MLKDVKESFLGMFLEESEIQIAEVRAEVLKYFKSSASCKYNKTKPAACNYSQTAGFCIRLIASSFIWLQSPQRYLRTLRK